MQGRQRCRRVLPHSRRRCVQGLGLTPHFLVPLSPSTFPSHPSLSLLTLRLITLTFFTGLTDPSHSSHPNPLFSPTFPTPLFSPTFPNPLFSPTFPNPLFSPTFPTPFSLIPYPQPWTRQQTRRFSTASKNTTPPTPCSNNSSYLLLSPAVPECP